ncbi:MAG: cytochrome c3 family protein [Planctomycetota bacterium]|jgi:predicted CXXCH cytochrome family protein
MRRILAVFVIVVLAAQVPLWAAHTDQGCSGCHDVHNAADSTYISMPLWSGIETQTSFTLYTSPEGTLDANDLGQPDGSSKMCLSCHDGSPSWSFSDPNHNFGDDLSDDHPISFTYDTALYNADNSLRDPNVALSGLGGTIAEDLLESDKVQCVSCHDVHAAAHTDMALHMVNDTGQLCKKCHNK